MRRAVARWQTWWLRLFVVVIVAGAALPIPWLVELTVTVGALLLYLVRPPASDRGPVEVAPPVRGRWVALNSPGSKVPSHGVRAYGQAYAVDLLRPDPDAPTSLGWSLRGRDPHHYPAYDEPVHAVAAGTVDRVAAGQRDHRARSSWPLLLWMLTIDGFVREVAGAPRILGNHVVVAHGDGTFAAYAHLRQGSVTVQEGQRVEVGEVLARVGNTGNTSEPHLHVQLMDRAEPTAAAGVPMRWRDVAVDPHHKDERWSGGKTKVSAQPGFPANGEVFDAEG